ncbi:PIR protein, partial [Plasmodium vivax]
IQKYVKTYKKFQRECQNKSPSPGYCNAFNKYFDKKDPERLSNLSCNIQDNETEREKKVEQVAVESQLPPAQGVEANTPTEAEQFSSGSGEKEKTYGSSVNTSREETPILYRDSDPTNVPSISTATKSIATAASAAGLLVPPFLIYNFTPVRSWINKLLGRNQIYRNPLTERELMENSYQPDNFDSERNRYNIMYRPE